MADKCTQCHRFFEDHTNADLRECVAAKGNKEQIDALREKIAIERMSLIRKLS